MVSDTVKAVQRRSGRSKAAGRVYSNVRGLPWESAPKGIAAGCLCTDTAKGFAP